jgi:hypothetical protein
VSHKLAGPSCPDTYDEYFLPGSLPESCDMHGAGKIKKTNIGRLFGPEEKEQKKTSVKKRLTF